jgi:hypothetical protein
MDYGFAPGGHLYLPWQCLYGSPGRAPPPAGVFGFSVL